MKYPARIYAKALAEIITDPRVVDDALVVKNFLALVERNGDSPHLRKILEEAARFARGKGGIRKVILETARPLDNAHRKALGSFMKAGDVVEETLNPELVAGVRIIVDDERQFDGSLKGRMDKLFGNLT